MVCGALLWRALLYFPTEQLTQRAQTAALALWCSLTSCLDVEIVCKTPTTSKEEEGEKHGTKSSAFFASQPPSFVSPCLCQSPFQPSHHISMDYVPLLVMHLNSKFGTCSRCLAACSIRLIISKLAELD